MFLLEGKTALVTGASRGIGRAAAAALADKGARVIVHYANSRAEADSVVSTIRGGGGDAEAVAADLSLPTGPQDLAVRVRAIAGERLDVLVANAGTYKMATLADTTMEDFDRLFAVNVRAPFFLLQQLMPLLQRGSSVICVSSSLAAHAPIAELSAYAATKGAINTLVRHFAASLGADGVRVNAVAPGVIDTDMSHFVKSEEGRTFVLGQQALKRISTPDDVGDAIAFLASDQARWVTGDVLRVDGGTGL